MDSDGAEVDANAEVGLGIRRWEGEAPFVHGAAAVLADEGGELRMVGPDDEERRSEQGVGPRGEDGHGIAGTALEPEIDEGSLAPADPVALGQLRPLAPVEVVEGVEHLLRVMRRLTNHCLRKRVSTALPQRSQWPLSTCSSASTVRHEGHQLTGPSRCSARPP